MNFYIKGAYTVQYNHPLEWSWSGKCVQTRPMRHIVSAHPLCSCINKCIACRIQKINPALWMYVDCQCSRESYVAYLKKLIVSLC